jgi:threonine synthase
VVAVSGAKRSGKEAICIASGGNSASSAAAYAARNGLTSQLFLTEQVPDEVIRQCQAFGAVVQVVEGGLRAAQDSLNEVLEAGWSDLSGERDPLRVEGIKTIAFEIAEALSWRAPDVVVCPTGSGRTVLAVIKGFRELTELGWLQGPLPRIIAVQVENCQPVVRKYRNEFGDDMDHVPLPERDLDEDNLQDAMKIDRAREFVDQDNPHLAGDEPAMEEELMGILARQFDVERIELESEPLDQGLIRRQDMRYLMARELLPVRDTGERILVAMVDPLDFSAMDEMKQFYRKEVEPRLCSRRAFRSVMGRIAESFGFLQSEAVNLLVPEPVFLPEIIEAISSTAGMAVAVSEKEIASLRRALALEEGVQLGAEGAAALAAVRRMAVQGILQKDDTVVAINPGCGYKY